MSQMNDADRSPTLFNHPTSLFTLFFAEMWERFSYYGMRALLVFYMIKGFLSYSDGDAYKVYGAYTALVYMTPFFGGMLADRLLGPRRAVVFGGLLMAGGHLLMTIEQSMFFFLALGLLIVGNGFFKPNISTMVGSLYKKGDVRRDGGFTIFYMGINLGAAMAPLLCGYVGETYGWHYGFGLATVGMLIGVGVFVVPNRISQILILAGALLTAVAMVWLQDTLLLYVVNGFVALALVVSGTAAFAALGRGGLSTDVGAPPDPEKLDKPFMGIRSEYAVYIGTLLFLPILALLVWSVNSFRVIPESVLEPLTGGSALLGLAATFLSEMSSLPGLLLVVTGVVGFSYLFIESLRSDSVVEKQRLWVVLIMMFFSMLFWAFFEQAGSSVNNFTDRNVDRVFEDRLIDQSDVGKTMSFRVEPRPKKEGLSDLPLLSQGQLGYSLAIGIIPEAELSAMGEQVAAMTKVPEDQRDQATKESLAKLEGRYKLLDALAHGPFTMTQLTELRNAAVDQENADAIRKVDVTITPDHVGMKLGGDEVPASTFQSANPIFILIFGLVFTALWTFLGNRSMEPSTPVKFALGLAQLGLGFGAMWYGASTADPRGMVGMHWVIFGYLLHTTGELCLSPVGLSMVTKLSPKRLVSTAMGAWFLATAFSNLLAAIIATFTGVGHGGDDKSIPVPKETVNVYGDVFYTIAATALVCAAVCFLISPVLKKWMHTEADKPDAEIPPARVQKDADLAQVAVEGDQSDDA